MKNLLVLLAVGIFSICAYHAWEVWTTPPPPPPVATPTPKPPERHLTPEGIFAVVEYLSVRTKNGVVGFEPGQMVRFVSADAAKGTLTVTDGSYQVEVQPEQLTNDLDVAKMARRQDQESQRRLQAIIVAARDEDTKMRQEAEVDRAKHVANMPSGATVGLGSSLSQGSVPASSADAAVNDSLRRGYRSYSSYGYSSGYGYGSPYYYLYH